MTEQDTFERLRRRDWQDVYRDCYDLMGRIAKRDRLDRIDTAHPEVAAWLSNESFTGVELAYRERKRREELTKQILSPIYNLPDHG